MATTPTIIRTIITRLVWPQSKKPSGGSAEELLNLGGNPAVLVPGLNLRPVALRPRLSTGLPFSPYILLFCWRYFSTKCSLLSRCQKGILALSGIFHSHLITCLS